MTATLPVGSWKTALSPGYSIRLARDPGEVLSAQALRFEVFNLEMNEGLIESYATGLDADPFDPVCDHLIVLELASGLVVGTYRLQTGAGAAGNLGYYSAQEFELDAWEPYRDELIELGRACIHPDHRNAFVLGLLWKGIASYANRCGARYLFGCSSITSQDPAEGASVYSALCRSHLAPYPWRTRPKTEFECSLEELADETPKIPKLLRAYLSLGAKICGPPALDRAFGTIDFLTILDLDRLPALTKRRFFSQSMA